MEISNIDDAKNEISVINKKIIESNKEIDSNKRALCNNASSRKWWLFLSLAIGVFLFYVLSAISDFGHFFKTASSSEIWFLSAITLPFIFFVILTIRNIRKAKSIENSQIELANSIEEMERFIDIKREEIQYIERQKEIHKKVGYVVNQVQVSTKKLPSIIENIAHLLMESKNLFKESQFAPFWDNIEKTMIEIDQYYDTIENIKDNTSYYHKLVLEYDGSQGKLIDFPLTEDTIKSLGIINELESTMKKIIYPAQSNINFASIYEMRRTNQILVAGFNNLSSAINGLSDTLSFQLNDLSCDLNNLGKILVDTKHSIESTGNLQIQQMNSNYHLQEKMVDDIKIIRRKYTGSLL